MKQFNSSLSTAFHLVAWLIILPFLLFLLFQNTTETILVPNNTINKGILAIIVSIVGVINSGLLVPHFLYIRKIAQYLLTVFVLLIIGVVLDLTLSISVSPVIQFIEHFSITRTAAIVAAIIISTSIRIIVDQRKVVQ